MTTTFSAMAKLYGLKLYRGEITENKIPNKHKTQAIEYCEYLKSIEY